MRTVVNLVALTACVVLVGVGVWTAHHLRATAPGAATEGGGGKRLNASPLDRNGTSSATPGDGGEVIRPPAMYAGYRGMSQADKLDLVTRHMHNKELPERAIAFLRTELGNRELLDVTRNNIANTLCWQREPDPGLHELFIGFIEDPEEGRTWREYSVQFLGETLRFTDDRKAVLGKLWELAESGREGLAGTAILQLALGERYADVELGPEFADLLGQALLDPALARRDRMTVVATLGQRGQRVHLPVIRRLAAQEDDDGLRRVAIAALGQLGDADADRDLLDAALSADNRAVVMAAEGARRRLGLD